MVGSNEAGSTMSEKVKTAVIVFMFRLHDVSAAGVVEGINELACTADPVMTALTAFPATSLIVLVVNEMKVFDREVAKPDVSLIAL